MDYLIVVNKSNSIEDSYYKDLELVQCKDVCGDDIKVEKRTYDAYLKLKKHLEVMRIFIELISEIQKC